MKNTFWVLALSLVLAMGAKADALLKPREGAAQNLSAKSLDVRVRVQDGFAQTMLTTIYRNPNDRRIEADFVYAAPKSATVTGFAYWFGEEKVVARVAEKRRAARIYQSITVVRRDPALVEMIGKNAFRARIFPVEAGRDLKVEIRYSQPLSPIATGWEYRFPLREAAGDNLESLFLETNGAANFSNGPQTNLKPTDDWRVQTIQALRPLKAALLARRDNVQNDGFFALQLVSQTPISNPQFRLSGVQTDDVIAPKLKSLPANAPFLVVGRFKGTGRAWAIFGDQKIALDFGNSVEPGSAARDLWAQARIESLSSSEKNRFQVVQLSQRFGLVSKWTNWIAIPVEERKRFEQQILQSDLWNAGAAYAQAISRGDRKTAQAQKAIWNGLNRKLGGANTLNYALNEELHRVQNALEVANYQTKSKAQIAQLKRFEKLLIAAGAGHSERDYEQYQRVDALLRDLAGLYAREIEMGRAQGAKGRALRTRMEFLASQMLPKQWRHRGRIRQDVEGAIGSRIEILTREMVAARGRGNWSNREATDYQTKITRLSATRPRYLIDQKRLESQYRTSFLNRELAIEETTARNQLEHGVPLETALREYKQKWLKRANDLGDATLPIESWRFSFPLINLLWRESQQTREKFPDVEPSIANPKIVQIAADLRSLREQSWEGWRDYYDTPLNQNLLQLARQQIDVALENGKNSPKARELQSQMESLVSKRNTTDQTALTRWALGTAAQDKAMGWNNELISQILEHTESPTAIADHQKRLSDLQKISPYQEDMRFFYSDADVWGAYAARAHEAAYRVLQSEKNGEDAARWRAELDLFTAQRQGDAKAILRWENQRIERGLPLQSAKDYYRLRPGDPLISVSAPQNCGRVLAIMPDGQVLPLSFNLQTKNWEARFDVPTWAATGDYAVQIVVVFEGGARQKLTMHFAVDTSAPSGKAGVKNGILQLETDAQTDRASAFLSDGSRVELKRDQRGHFRASAPVGFDGGKVRFILTDKAHNRTEIWVEK